MFDFVADAKCQERVLAAEAPAQKEIEQETLTYIDYIVSAAALQVIRMQREQLPEG